MQYRLKAYRVGKGYKQGEFARLLGISREYLRLLENGKSTNPSVDLMKRIAAALDTTPQELFFEE